MSANLNFNLPLDFSRLENDRLKIVPLEENLEEWLKIYCEDGKKNPQVFDYLTAGPFDDPAEFVEMYKEHFPNEPSEQLLAVILKAGTVTTKDPVTGEVKSWEVPDGTFAGLSGMGGTPKHAQAEMGLMLCTPFHRTFVSTHVNGLTLHYFLDSPEQGGLGLRRVAWRCNADNKASIHTAERIGFKMEGITRWQQVLPLNKKGSKGAEIDMKGLPKVGWEGQEWGPGRHTANLSLCWEDWVNGGREHVDKMMKR